MLDGPGIDFESIGMAQGMALAVRRARAETDAAVEQGNIEIRKANAEIARLRTELAKAKATHATEVKALRKGAEEIRLKANDIISRLRSEVAQGKAALAIESAGLSGCLKMAFVLEGQLRSVDPENEQLDYTGLKYPNGILQTYLLRMYDIEFKRVAEMNGVVDVDRVRPPAS